MNLKRVADFLLATLMISQIFIWSNLVEASYGEKSYVVFSKNRSVLYEEYE